MQIALIEMKDGRVIPQVLNATDIACAKVQLAKYHDQWSDEDKANVTEIIIFEVTEATKTKPVMKTVLDPLGL